MPIGKLAHTHLPYCLERAADGSWLVLNRNYKPVGATSKDWIDYEAAPGRLKIDGRSIEAIARAMHNVDRDEAGKPMRMWLYDDRVQPGKDAASMSAYMQRLAKLANTKVTAA